MVILQVLMILLESVAYRVQNVGQIFALPASSVGKSPPR